MLNTSSFFDLNNFEHAQIFAETPVWSGLHNLKKYMDNFPYPQHSSTYIPLNSPLTETVILHEGHVLCDHSYDISFGDTTKGKLIVKHKGIILEGASVIMAGATLMGKQIAIGKGVLIENGAMVKSPAIIGDNTEIRHGAYLRGYTLLGKRCVAGHTTEIKHSIFLDDAKAGHFAYLGDSVLGNNSNLGAGTKFANLRFLDGTVKIRTKDGLVDTDRRKFGAILGDEAQTGCNSVTNPGTILGKKGMLMPNTTAASGLHSPKTIIR